MTPLLADTATTSRDELGSCANCGAPTSGDVCTFCRLVDRTAGQAAVPVELVARPGRPGGRRRR
jgi:recombinational DNA repair protein RecR